VVPGGAAHNPPNLRGSFIAGKANPPTPEKNHHTQTISYTLAYLLHFFAVFTDKTSNFLLYKNYPADQGLCV
ncbi:hypothetical protein, partial [Enterobacter intestinihominis]